MNEKVVAWSIPITLASIVAGAYLTYWRGRRLPIRRGASWVLATVSALAGDVGTVAYSVPALDDLHDPAVSFKTAVVRNLIVWAIFIGAWGVAVRFSTFALRQHTS